MIEQIYSSLIIFLRFFLSSSIVSSLNAAFFCAVSALNINYLRYWLKTMNSLKPSIIYQSIYKPSRSKSSTCWKGIFLKKSIHIKQRQLVVLDNILTLKTCADPEIYLWENSDGYLFRKRRGYVPRQTVRKYTSLVEKKYSKERPLAPPPTPPDAPMDPRMWTWMS